MKDNTEPTKLVLDKDITLDKIIEIFPKNIHYELLEISNVGLYSITKKNEAYYICNLITKLFPDMNITITDSTACIGGNTISFQLNENVKKVNAVEICDIHFGMLRNNVKLYKNNEKVNFYNCNFLDIYRDLEQDVIFYDLPWGGVDYKKNELIELSLKDSNENPVSMNEIINNSKYSCKVQAIKVPLNFNFPKFFCEINYNKFKVHKIFNKYTKKLNYYIILLIN